MGHLADQPRDGLTRQFGVRIEGNDIAHSRRRHGGIQVGGPLPAAEQPIQFQELAALALPPDPAPFAGVPHPAAVQQQEPVAGGRRTVFGVEPGDGVPRRRQQGVVALHMLARGVGPVGQQREIEFARRARQIMDLQASDLFVDGGRRGQQGGHGDQGAPSRRNLALQRQGW